MVARKVRENEDPKVDVSKAKYRSNPLYPDIWYEVNGGSAPKVTTFEEALENGEIDWYTKPDKDKEEVGSEE